MSIVDMPLYLIEIGVWNMSEVLKVPPRNQEFFDDIDEQAYDQFKKYIGIFEEMEQGIKLWNDNDYGRKILQHRKEISG